jgi:hypothetical protein
MFFLVTFHGLQVVLDDVFYNFPTHAALSLPPTLLSRRVVFGYGMRRSHKRKRGRR